MSLFTLKCGFSQASLEPQQQVLEKLSPGLQPPGAWSLTRRNAFFPKAPADNHSSRSVQSGTLGASPSVYSLPVLCLFGE